jgi:uncharacterized membrane protein YbhN (UPF0104 family)
MNIGLTEKTTPSLLENRPSVGDGKREVKYSILKKLAALLVVLVIFFFLGRSLYHNLGELGAQSWSIKPIPLVLSFFLLILNLAVSAFVWKEILHLFGSDLPFDQSFKIMSLSGLGKYLPGKIWLYLSQVYLSQKANISKRVCIFSLLLLFAAYNLAGLLVFIASLLLWKKFSPVYIGILILAVSLIFPVIFSPRILNGLITAFTSLFRKLKNKFPQGELAFRAGTKKVLEIILILLADWLVFGIAVYLLVNSFYHIDLQQTVILCGIFAISSILGILSFFVPAGLGVREGAQSYLLAMFIPVSAAILISLVMRVWMTLGELVCFVIAWKIKKPEVW